MVLWNQTLQQCRSTRPLVFRRNAGQCPCGWRRIRSATFRSTRRRQTAAPQPASSANSRGSSEQLRTPRRRLNLCRQKRSQFRYVMSRRRNGRIIGWLDTLGLLHMIAISVPSCWLCAKCSNRSQCKCKICRCSRYAKVRWTEGRLHCVMHDLQLKRFHKLV